MATGLACGRRSDERDDSRFDGGYYDTNECGHKDMPGKEGIMTYEDRYYLDFIQMPVLFHNGQGRAVSLITGNVEEKLCSIYNKACFRHNGEMPFTEEEFNCRRVKFDEGTILYIKLPKTDIGSPMICTHMAVAYKKDNGRIHDVRLLQVERGMLGTVAIGEIIFNRMRILGHANYGTAAETDDDNIEKIRRIAFGNVLPLDAAQLISEFEGTASQNPLP